MLAHLQQGKVQRVTDKWKSFGVLCGRLAVCVCQNREVAAEAACSEGSKRVYKNTSICHHNACGARTDETSTCADSLDHPNQVRDSQKKNIIIHETALVAKTTDAAIDDDDDDDA